MNSGCRVHWPVTATQANWVRKNILELMTEQLQNQDPFKPMENGDFIAQLAQFGTVSGIEDLRTELQNLSGSLFSNQAMQAAGMMGRDGAGANQPGSAGKRRHSERGGRSAELGVRDECWNLQPERSAGKEYWFGKSVARDGDF